MIVVSDLLSLADAAVVLGVSPERVRQLVVAGDLPGVRFGNAWAVPRDAVLTRRHMSGRRGRPLGPRRVWEMIARGEVDLGYVGRFRNRGEVYRYSMTAGDVEHLRRRRDVVVSGVDGSVAFGELLSSEDAPVDLYMARSAHESLGSDVVAVVDPLGSVVVRVVADELWPLVEAMSTDGDEGFRVAPRGAVALDLMESGDPRHWVAAEHLVEFVG